MIRPLVLTITLLALGAMQPPQPGPSPTPSPTPTPSPSATPPPSEDKPTDSDTPALSNRLFSSDTSSYDVKLPLGRFATVDRKKGVVTEFLNKGRFACPDKQALETANAPALKPTPATSQVVDQGYKGSLSIFVVDAKLTKNDREELTVTDVATADLANTCQLDRQTIYKIARGLPGAEGLDVIWVSGTTLSNLNLRKYSKVDGGISGGGSWLSIGADGYKGSEKIDSVPVFALRGYIVHVPGKAEAARVIAPVARSFSTLSDVGLSRFRVVRSSAALVLP